MRQVEIVDGLGRGRAQLWALGLGRGKKQLEGQGWGRLLTKEVQDIIRDLNL